MEDKLSESLEDYLEFIYNMIQKNQTLKAVDISNAFNYSRASITEALNKLSQKGFINYEKYGQILMTEKGIKKAQEIVSLHKELTIFFENLGVNKKEADITACKIEHIVSLNVKEKILAFNRFCEKNPEFKF